MGRTQTFKNFVSAVDVPNKAPFTGISSFARSIRARKVWIPMYGDFAWSVVERNGSLVKIQYMKRHEAGNICVTSLAEIGHGCDREICCWSNAFACG